jgi:hypothetical protein
VATGIGTLLQCVAAPQVSGPLNEPVPSVPYSFSPHPARVAAEAVLDDPTANAATAARESTDAINRGLEHLMGTQ